MPKRTQGFTVLELMVVLSLIAIAAAIAAPSFKNARDDWQIRRAARDVADVFFMARQLAMRSQSNVIFSMNTGNLGWNDNTAGLHVDSDGDGVFDDGEEVYRVFQNYPEYTKGVEVWWNQAIMWAKNPAIPQHPDDANGMRLFERLVWTPDGVPRSTNPSLAGPINSLGEIGSGARAYYLVSQNSDTGVITIEAIRRQYVVLLDAIGGVKVSQWDKSRNEWVDQ